MLFVLYFNIALRDYFKTSDDTPGNLIIHCVTEILFLLNFNHFFYFLWHLLFFFWIQWIRWLSVQCGIINYQVLIWIFILWFLFLNLLPTVTIKIVVIVSCTTSIITINWLLMVVPVIFIGKIFTRFIHLWWAARHLVMTPEHRDWTEDHVILWDLYWVEQVIEKGVGLLVVVGVVMVHKTSTIII